MKETCEKGVADKIGSSTISTLTDLIATLKKTALVDVSAISYLLYFIFYSHLSFSVFHRCHFN